MRLVVVVDDDFPSIRVLTETDDVDVVVVYKPQHRPVEVWKLTTEKEPDKVDVIHGSMDANVCAQAVGYLDAYPDEEFEDSDDE